MTALIVLGALAGYVAFVAAVVRFIGHAGEDVEPDEPIDLVPVEFTGCADPACECRAARARVLDILAATGQVPGLAWGDRDDDAVAALLDGGCE